MSREGMMRDKYPTLDLTLHCMIDRQLAAFFLTLSLVHDDNHTCMDVNSAYCVLCDLILIHAQLHAAPLCGSG